MPEVASRYQDELKRIKKNINNAREYFQPNYNRFNEFRKFVFKSSLSDSDLTLLDSLNKPQVEFNVLEAYVSRLRGEFSKQEPSIEVSQNNNEQQIDPKLIEFLEGHLRYILFEANNDSFEYQVYTDGLSGGFSVVKLLTDYAHERSFVQDIKVQRVYDPVMCGFDPMARLPHKGDGKYCFEIYPMTEDDFKELHPDVDISGLSYNGSLAGFDWTYRNAKEKILLVADYYEKKQRRTKIVKLANNKTLTWKEYKEEMEQWNLEGHIEQYPAVVYERYTLLTTICRYIVIDDQVVDYKETDFSILPLIYMGGNSILLRDPDNKEIEEMSRPYVYHAHDAQTLKNYAGQCLANELESMVMHKFKVAKESIPDEEDYRMAYNNVQQANTLVYNAFMDYNPSSATPPIQIPPPQEIARVPAPPEITQAFTLADQTIQAILGSYDAALGINNNQLSGIAIVEGATQSNAAGMPYVVSFMQMLTQLGRGVLDLIPKYCKTPRTIPIVTKDGKKHYVKINGKDGLKIEYSPDALNIKIEAGVSFAIQKNRALQQIIALSQASQEFSAFINQKGLPVLLDNLEIRGIDKLKLLADEWLVEQKQQQAQAAQNNPVAMKMQLEHAKLQEQIKQNAIDNQLKQQDMQIDAANIQASMTATHNDTLRIALDAKEAKDNAILEAARIQERKEAKAADLLMDIHDQHHRHTKEAIELAHKVSQSHVKLPDEEVPE